MGFERPLWVIRTMTLTARHSKNEPIRDTAYLGHTQVYREDRSDRVTIARPLWSKRLVPRGAIRELEQFREQKKGNVMPGHTAPNRQQVGTDRHKTYDINVQIGRHRATRASPRKQLPNTHANEDPKPTKEVGWLREPRRKNPVAIFLVIT